MEGVGLLIQPGLDAAAGAARSQFQHRSRALGGAVDEAGEPRIRPLLEVIPSSHQRRDLNRVASIPGRDVGSGSGRCGDQGLWASARTRRIRRQCRRPAKTCAAVKHAAGSTNDCVTRSHPRSRQQPGGKSAEDTAGSTQRSRRSATTTRPADRRRASSLIPPGADSLIIARAARTPGRDPFPAPGVLFDAQLHRRRTGPLDLEDATRPPPDEQHRPRVGQHTRQQQLEERNRAHLVHGVRGYVSAGRPGCAFGGCDDELAQVVGRTRLRLSDPPGGGAGCDASGPDGSGQLRAGEGCSRAAALSWQAPRPRSTARQSLHRGTTPSPQAQVLEVRIA